MNACKYKVEDTEEVKIEYNMLERDGMKRKPYFNYIAEETYCFAVCHKCNNPVQLIGLYKKNGVSDNPFGKHYKNDVPDLVDYSQDSYDFCPLTDPGKTKIFPVRFKGMDDDAINIYNTVRNKFDKILYFLEKDTGLYYSEKLSKSLMKDYLSRQGWLYRGARVDNIPWIFAYMTLQQTFFGRWIVKGSKLHRNMLTHKNSIEITDTVNARYVQVKSKDSRAELCFHFTNHRVKADSDHNISEYIDFAVFINEGDCDNDIERLFTQKILLNVNHFLNTVDKPSWNDTHIQWAKDVLPEIPNKVMNEKMQSIQSEYP